MKPTKEETKMLKAKIICLCLRMNEEKCHMIKKKKKVIVCLVLLAFFFLFFFIIPLFCGDCSKWEEERKNW